MTYLPNGLCAVFLFLTHFDVIYDPLLSRRTTIWNVCRRIALVWHKRKKPRSHCRKSGYWELGFVHRLVGYDAITYRDAAIVIPSPTYLSPGPDRPHTQACRVAHPQIHNHFRDHPRNLRLMVRDLVVSAVSPRMHDMNPSCLPREIHHLLGNRRCFENHRNLRHHPHRHSRSHGDETISLLCYFLHLQNSSSAVCILVVGNGSSPRFLSLVLLANDLIRCPVFLIFRCLA